MLKKLPMVGLVIAALASVPVASADSSPQRRIARLEHTVQSLRAELHATRSRLAAANRKSAKARGQVAAVRRRLADQTASFQTTVQQLGATQQQVTALGNEVSSLQAQLAAVPTALAQAEAQLESKIRWAEQFAPSSYSSGMITALAAMDYVSTHVSSTAAVFAPPVSLPPGGDQAAYANAILTAGVGECSYHVLVFDVLMAHFGYRTRAVSFYYQDAWTQAAGAHSAVEVFYDGVWHYFDPTYSVYWTDPTTGNVLDIATERQAGDGLEHKNNGLFLNLFENPFYNGDTTGFETDPATDVVIGQVVP